MDAEFIYLKARNILRHSSSRNPLRIADDLGINVRYNSEHTILLGMYVVSMKNRFIFLNENMDSFLFNQVVAHEIGHDQLHRKLANKALHEFTLFNVKDNTEYEANAFASHLLMDNDDVMEKLKEGYTIEEAASFFEVHLPMMIIKLNEMKKLGYKMNPLGYNINSKFLKKCTPQSMYSW